MRMVDLGVRIAQVCPRYHPYVGGVETHVREVSERLAKRGFEVEVLTTDPSGALPRNVLLNDVKVVRFGSWAPSQAYYVSIGLYNYLMANSARYDIVHAHCYHAFPALYSACAKGVKRWVFNPHYHGTGHTFFRSLLHVPYRLVAKKMLERADAVICVSNFERRLLCSHFKIPGSKIATIRNGINPEEFTTPRKKKRSTVLYVGRLEKYKGVDSLIRALPHLGNFVMLEVVGSGPYKKRLTSLAQELGVRSRVRFYDGLGRKDLLLKYAEAGLFALPSKYEASGITVGEALASGTVCVVANRSGLKEWIDDVNCFGIDYPINVEKLAYLIGKTLGKKPNRLRVTTWDENVETLIALYGRLSSQPCPTGNAKTHATDTEAVASN
jgi:glycosyltransferase involved in cell wall biosynthesis